MFSTKHSKQKSEDFHLPAINKQISHSNLQSPKNPFHSRTDSQQDNNYYKSPSIIYEQNHEKNHSIMSIQFTENTNQQKNHLNLSILDYSAICLPIQHEFQENIERIDEYETKIARMSPINYSRIDEEIKQLLTSKDAKKVIDKHTWLVSDHIQIIELQKQKVSNFKFPLALQPNSSKGYPLKVKATNQEGYKFDLFSSFVDPNQEENLGMQGSYSWEFLNRKDHIYAFKKPPISTNFLFISMRAPDFIKVEIKISFSDKNIEQLRQKIIQKQLSVQNPKVYKSMKEKQSKNRNKISLQQQQAEEREQREKERRFFEKEIQEIIIKRNEKLKKFYAINMVERNIEFADNLNLIKKKQSLSHITHHIKCEEVYRKSLQNQIQDYKQKRNKIVQRSLEKEMRKINAFVRHWQTQMKFFKVINYFYNKYEKQIIKYLFLNIFKSKRDRILNNIKRTFLNYRKMDFTILSSSNLIIRDSSQSTLMYCKKVKKSAQYASCQIIKDFILNGMVEEMLKHVKKRILSVHQNIKNIQISLRNKKKHRLQVIQNLIDYQIKMLETQSNNILNENQIQLYSESLPNLKFIQPSHINQICNRFLNVQKEKCNKMFQVYLEKEEPQEKDYEEINRIITAEQLKTTKANKKYTVTVIEKLEKLQESEARLITIINSAFDRSFAPQQNSNQYISIFYKVKIKRLKLPGLHLVRDKNQLITYLLESLPAILSDHQIQFKKQEQIMNQHSKDK